MISQLQDWLGSIFQRINLLAIRKFKATILGMKHTQIVPPTPTPKQIRNKNEAANGFFLAVDFENVFL